MPQKGDIFDLGTNEYVEFVEKFDETTDYVIHYTREPMPDLGELKLHKLIESGGLDGELRKIGPNEKDRLLTVYKRALQKHVPELEDRLKQG